MRVASRAALLLAADIALLTVLWPDWAALVGDLDAPADWAQQAGIDGAAATLAAAALWLTAAWLGAGLAAAALAGAPGAAGRVADHLARAVLPRALYRAAEGAGGLGVLLAPVAAGAHAPARHLPLPAPTAPTAAAAGDTSTDGGVLPAPVLPSSPSAHPPSAHPPSAHPPSAQPPSAHPPSRRSQPPSPPAAGTALRVLVRPGDSLWRIAAQHLPRDASPARIARTWPRWYAANRAVIGTDPNRIMPGQQLQAPTTPATPTTPTATTQEP
jgi:hypothetical protein